MMEFLSVEIVENRLLDLLGEISGTDTDDRVYDSITDMWEFELNSNSDNGQNPWYGKAYDYWENEANCPVSEDGVLGGYGLVTDVDARESTVFLNRVKALRPLLQTNEAAGNAFYYISYIYIFIFYINYYSDCGAGIGRVSKFFLLPNFRHVDLVEQSPRLLEASASYIGPDASRTSQICVNLKVISLFICCIYLKCIFSPCCNMLYLLHVMYVFNIGLLSYTRKIRCHMDTMGCRASS